MALLRDDQFLAGLDLIRVAELVAVGLEDLHVLAGAAVVFLGDLGERVARFYRVGAMTGGPDARPHGARRLRRGAFVDGDIRSEVGIARVNELDLVPDAVLGILR